MIHLVIACSYLCIFGAGGVPLYRKGPYAPSPPGMRPSCAVKSMTFCENVDKYPTKLIQTLLQSKSLDMYDFFTDESEGLEEPPEHILHQEMATDPNETSRKKRSIENHSKGSNATLKDFRKLCPIRNNIVTPQIASNTDGVWKLVAQDDDSKLKQKVTVQLCHQSEECKKSCTQFFSPVPMLSVDNAGEISKDTFWMPSSCQCFDTSTSTF